MATQSIRNYWKNESGQFALWTAIIALPLTLATSMVIDLQFMDKNKAGVKSALDSAALAAITHQTLTPQERADYASERFYLNIPEVSNVDLKVLKSEDYRVELKAQMKVPTLMASIIGKDHLKFETISATELTKGATVCMLTLDKDSPKSFHITGGASLDASTCGVQVNSIHKQASLVDHGGKASAKSFCIAGGAKGNYAPFANTQCSLLENPYKTLEMPEAGECIDQQGLDSLLNHWTSSVFAVEQYNQSVQSQLLNSQIYGFEYTPIFLERTKLHPGNYCNGLNLTGKEIELNPGVYHINSGELLFNSGTKVTGKGVTFIFHNDANLRINEGAYLDLKAPSTGVLAGLVFAQDLGNKPYQSAKYPDVISTITSGGTMNLIGTAYLPSHKIEFLGGSLTDSQAPATSFIAHHISIGDGAEIGVAVDHLLAEIPPILPRSDDGARLVE